MPIHRRVLGQVLSFLALSTAPSIWAASTVQEGIGFLAIKGGTEGTVMVLEDRHHHEVARGTVDRLGGLVFRELQQGARYVIREDGATEGTAARVRRFKELPDAGFYSGQTLHDGLNYLATRDGTLLAAMVRPPLGKTLDQGPFPTVVEYSGYAAADPDNPQPSTLISGALGFATVGVNMRGSGCSGGIFDLFDLPTTADGYDIIEVVAAQSWVKGGKVGMVGISFPGISQLFVGGAHPPHLAAIAPLSVISDIYRSPGYPGGIFNNGFAQTWLAERVSDARPAPEGGQSWAIKRVNDGDATCLANQSLRLQTQDALVYTQEHPFYDPKIMDNRSPINWVGKIRVPTFLSSAWQDEQTGGGFAEMLSRLPKRPDVKITSLNGVHSSTLDPAVIWNWFAFIKIYVAGEVPDPTLLGALVAPVLYPTVLGAGTPLPPLPSNRFADVTDLAAARQLFEDGPHMRVLMENGAGSPTAGLPATTFELGFSQWPPKEIRPTIWYLGAGGTLDPERPRGSDAASDSFHPDPSVRPEQTLPGQGQEDSWKVLPPYDWEPLVAGTAVAYATPPLSADTTIVGPGSVDLWLSSSATDTDLQVTLSEIRPDGLETYVQNGWLRASHRKLDRRNSSVIDPVVTHLEHDAKPLTPGELTKVRVALFAVGHVFRAGSRIRVSIEAPGGDRTRWRFDTFTTKGAIANEIGRDAAHPSRIVLSVVPIPPGVQVPPTLPPCPGLRGQPCRTYVPSSTGG